MSTTRQANPASNFATPLPGSFVGLEITSTGQLARHIAAGRPLSQNPPVKNDPKKKGKGRATSLHVPEPSAAWRRRSITPAKMQDRSARAGPSRHRTKGLRNQDPPSPSRHSPASDDDDDDDDEVVVSSPAKKRKRKIIKATDSEDSDAGSERVGASRPQTLSSLKKRRERNHSLFGSTWDEAGNDIMPAPAAQPPLPPSSPTPRLHDIDITSSPEPEPIATTSNVFQSMMARKNRGVEADSPSSEDTKQQRIDKQKRRKARRKLERGPNGEKNPLSKTTQAVEEELSESSQRDTQLTGNGSESDVSMGSIEGGKKDLKGKGKKKVIAASEEGEESEENGRPSDDEDDLSLSGKETLTVERLRETKPGPKTKFEALRLARQKKEADLAKLELIRKRGIVISSSDESEPASPARRSHSSQRRSDGSISPRLVAPKRTPKYLGAVSSPEYSSHGSDTTSGSAQDNADSEEDLAGFIVKEDENDEGSKKLVAEYRAQARAATQGLPFHIKVFIQYQIHRIISPGSKWLERERDFKVSNHYVLAELSGIRDLLIVSAAWKPAFKKSLDMYPNLAVDFIEYQIGENMDEKYPCGACGRRGKRRATKELTFSGSRYNPVTFQAIPVKVKDDSDGTSDDSEDELGAKTWYLGADCAERAHVYHTLQHLALDTDTVIRNALDAVWVRVPRKEVLALQKLKKVDREKYKIAKRAMQLKLEEEADRCCAVMDESGKVRTIARKFTSSVENAKNIYTVEK